MKTTNQDSSETGFMRRVRALVGRRQAAEPAAVVREEGRPKPNPATSPKVLIVDDDPVFVKATTVKLENEGFAVVAAKDGSEAIAAMREQKPSLLLLDVEFPSDVSMVAWDGFSIMSWLRRFEEGRRIPIIMVSGGDPLKYVRRALTSGAKAFFHKSTNPGNLVSAIKLTLAGKLASMPQPAQANFQI